MEDVAKGLDVAKAQLSAPWLGKSDGMIDRVFSDWKTGTLDFNE